MMSDELELVEYEDPRVEDDPALEDFPSQGNVGDVWLPQGY